MPTLQSRIQSTILFLFIFVIFLPSCDSGSSFDKQQTSIITRPAKLIEVGSLHKNTFLNYPAVIDAANHSILSFEVGGQLEVLNVVEAQRVKKGDVLAKLNQRDLQAKLRSARAEYKNANAEYRRALRLIKEDAISRSTVEQRRSKRDVSKAKLDTAIRAKENSVLIAPYTGVIAKVFVKKLQIIQPGASAITILGRDGGFKASINLPASILARVKRRSKRATNSYVVLDAAPERRIPAKFKEASLEVDAASQTYKITFSFNSPNSLVVLPGMNAVVWFENPVKTSKSSRKILVPLTAIATDGNQKYVWVVDRSSMRVSRRNITIEAGVGISLNVTSGLKSGEMIVAAGVSSLSAGMKVRSWKK